MSSPLLYKPDFDAARDAWRHFWAGEPWKRPLVVANVAKPGATPLTAETNPWHRRYHRAVTRDWDAQLKRIDALMESTIFFAEAMPWFSPDLGPDQFAAFLGATLKFSPDSMDTNWVDPIVQDWSTFRIPAIPEAPAWHDILAFSRKLAAHAKGRYLVGACDLHSNMDTLCALRGSEQVCMDILDDPERIHAAMREVRRLYPVVYNGLWNAGGMTRELGTSGWTSFWCDGRFATIQCDFICLFSPKTSRDYIIPALEEEATYLDHCLYHLDGVTALPHLDDILAIKRIEAMQWVPGAGQKIMWEWLDILKRCLAAGKGLHVYQINAEQVKQVHRELRSNRVVYDVALNNLQEGEELVRWLEANS